MTFAVAHRMAKDVVVGVGSVVVRAEQDRVGRSETDDGVATVSKAGKSGQERVGAEGKEERERTARD